MIRSFRSVGRGKGSPGAGAGLTTAPSFVAAGAGTDVATSGTLAVPYPGSVAAGQLFLMQLMSRQKTTNPTTPAGWTLISPIAAGGDTHVNSTQWLYARTARATGSESGTVSLTTGNGNMWAARMYSFINVDTGTYIEGAVTASGGSGVCAGPSISTAGTHRLALAFYAIDQQVTMGANSGASGGTWTEAVAEFASGAGSNGSIQLQTATMLTAGTISGGSSNFGGGSDDTICRGFALIGI
jgi:MSHA biogenesis protein MshQ